MNNNYKLFKDILRDKGSLKFSITKFLAFFTFVFLIIYLTTYLLFLGKLIDHTLVVELIGFIGMLVGLKNKWGVKSEIVDNTAKTSVFLESKDDKTNEDDEATF